MTLVFIFFFNDTATTEIYTLSLHDALPISLGVCLHKQLSGGRGIPLARSATRACLPRAARSEEHTSELQSPCNLVCRLLLVKNSTLATCSPTASLSPAAPLVMWQLSLNQWI